jgi:hypothetical protein
VDAGHQSGEVAKARVTLARAAARGKTEAVGRLGRSHDGLLAGLEEGCVHGVGVAHAEAGAHITALVSRLGVRANAKTRKDRHTAVQRGRSFNRGRSNAKSIIQMVDGVVGTNAAALFALRQISHVNTQYGQGHQNESEY